MVVLKITHSGIKQLWLSAAASLWFLQVQISFWFCFCVFVFVFNWVVPWSSLHLVKAHWSQENMQDLGKRNYSHLLLIFRCWWAIWWICLEEGELRIGRKSWDWDDGRLIATLMEVSCDARHIFICGAIWFSKACENNIHDWLIKSMRTWFGANMLIHQYDSVRSGILKDVIFKYWAETSKMKFYKYMIFFLPSTYF